MFSPTPTSSSPPAPVSLLILGAGWTFGFLEPLLAESHPDIPYAATTRDGRNSSIKWTWDAEDDGEGQYEALPKASTVVVTFPIRGVGGSRRLVEGYEKVHGKAKWVQLGSTGIWDNGPTLIAQRQSHLSSNPDAKFTPSPFHWTTRHSPYATSNPRAAAEDELLSLSNEAVVLNLAGLWGGSRDIVNWIPRVCPNKEAVRVKGSLHLIHGRDVARAIVAVHLAPPRALAIASPAGLSAAAEKSKPLGRRYLLTDLRVYDWWDLASSRPVPPADEAARTDADAHRERVAGWVGELLEEEGVEGLPRSAEELGRAMSSREFWREFGVVPEVGRWEQGRT